MKLVVKCAMLDCIKSFQAPHIPPKMDLIADILARKKSTGISGGNQKVWLFYLPSFDVSKESWLFLSLYVYFNNSVVREEINVPRKIPF